MLKIYQLRLKQNTFEVTLKYKGVGVRVVFEDGNTYNGTPARCHTNDPFKQKAIEASQMFKDKDIVLERQVEEASDRQAKHGRTANISSRIKPMAAPAGKTAAQTSPKVEGTAAEGTVAAPAPEPVAQAPADTEPATETAPKGDGMKTMEFQNPAEAILYIAQTWQIQVQTEAEARQTLKEHGINPKIKRG